MKTEIRVVTGDDLRWLAPRLRDVDLQEGYEVTGSTDTLSVLRESVVVSSWSGVMLIDDELVAVGGIGCGETEDSCIPWFVGTDKLADHPVTVMRHARILIESLKESFTFMDNWMLHDNEAGRRFVEVLGFEFDGQQLTGAGGSRMDRFVWRKR